MSMSERCLRACVCVCVWCVGVRMCERERVSEWKWEEMRKRGDGRIAMDSTGFLAGKAALAPAHRRTSSSSGGDRRSRELEVWTVHAEILRMEERCSHYCSFNLAQKLTAMNKKVTELHPPITSASQRTTEGTDHLPVPHTVCCTNYRFKRREVR